MSVGRRPTPTALKIIQGNPGNRPLEPDLSNHIPAQVPEPPPILKGQALKEWQRISIELEKLGLITELDMAALASYCQCYARWLEAEEMIAKVGMVVMSPANFPIQSPYLAIANRAMEQMRAYLIEFGMTPAARARVGASAQLPLFPDDDPMEAFLRGTETAALTRG